MKTNRLTEPGGGLVNGKVCQERGVELYWRLKQYEDTGLSPEEIKEICGGSGMFKVKNKTNGRIYTVYAVSGTRFLVWNDGTEDEHWEWMDMERFRPVEGC